MSRLVEKILQEYKSLADYTDDRLRHRVKWMTKALTDPALKKKHGLFKDEIQKAKQELARRESGGESIQQKQITPKSHHTPQPTSTVISKPIIYDNLDDEEEAPPKPVKSVKVSPVEKEKTIDSILSEIDDIFTADKSFDSRKVRERKAISKCIGEKGYNRYDSLVGPWFKVLYDAGTRGKSGDEIDAQDFTGDSEYYAMCQAVHEFLTGKKVDGFHKFG